MISLSQLLTVFFRFGFTAAFFCFLLLSNQARGASAVPVPITQVVLDANGTEVIQNASGAGGLNALVSDLPTYLKTVTINDAGTTKVLGVYATQDITLRDVSITGDQADKSYARNNGVSISSTSAGFNDALKSVITSVDLRDYLADDSILTGPGGYSSGVLSITYDNYSMNNDDYLVIQERDGNSEFSVEVVDRLGNLIAGSTTLDFVSGTMPWDTGYDAGSGVNSYDYQNQFIGVIKISDFGVDTDVTPIGGFRFTSENGADAKILGASEDAFDLLKDYGDAPATFADASAVLSADIYLGETGPDDESGSQNSHQALADGEEDDGAPQVKPGITLFPILIESDTSYTTPITVNNNSGSAATLEGWIDFDHSDTFDADEKTTVTVPDSTSGTVNLNWLTIPNDIGRGTAYIRLRLTSDSTGAGEVEDHLIGIAIEVPSESSSVAVINNEAVKSCQAVIFNDDFNDLSSSTYIGEYRSGSSAVRGWTVTGGGEDTYARVEWQATGDKAIYLGNGTIRRISPSLLSVGEFSFDADGRLTSAIDAIELRTSLDDSMPGVTTGLASWGPDEVVFSRTFASEVGTTYRLYFTATPEGSRYNEGMMRIDTPAGSAHLKTPASGSADINYAIEFTAAGSSSTIAFVNYGHVGPSYGGHCDVNPLDGSNQNASSWCTFDGTENSDTTLTNELIFDDVYLVEAACDQDYSDASDDGSTAPNGTATTSYGIASHNIVTSIKLGSSITLETSSVEGADNTSDDGVNISSLVRSSNTTITATVAGTGGYLQGWIDWNGDGDFADTGEQILNDLQDGDAEDTNTATGSISFSVRPPNTAFIGTTTARFRWSTDSGVTSIGLASDGEVEDYQVTVTSTPTQPTGGLNIIADAPVLYCKNTLVNGDFEADPEGTYWGVNRLGASGLTGWTASGGGTDTYADTNIGAGGITNKSAYFGNGRVKSVLPVLTDGFTFDAKGEATNVPSIITIRDATDDVSGISGATPGTISNCCDYGGSAVSLSQTVATTAGQTYRLRFTVKGEGGSGSAGVVKLSIDGEYAHFQVPGNDGVRSYTVEFIASGTSSTVSFINYGHFSSDSGGYCDTTTSGYCTVNGLGDSNATSEVTLDDVELAAASCDFGDAPDSYGDAEHVVPETPTIYLGDVSPDYETETQNTANGFTDGSGDDVNGIDDEDGFSIPALRQEQASTITTIVNGVGYLQGWIDWNADGDFTDSGEQIVTNLEDGGTGDLDAASGSISFDITPPVDAKVGTTFARFRWSSELGIASTDSAIDGEVEDYAVTVLHSLKGVIFEDINYGGGVGRDQATASGIGLNGVTVELYDSTGIFVSSTTTAKVDGIDGVYQFAVAANDTYSIRVVSDSVSSTRTGSDGSELAVQTFRTDGTTAVTSEVGGRNPAVADSASYDTGSPSVLNTTNGLFTGGILDSGQAQSLQTVTIVDASISGIDFGFNFDTIVNTNDAGQGSLRQFILNSNLLDNTGLEQDGLTAGTEHSIFMLPVSDPNYSVATGWVISPMTSLTTVTDSHTTIDAGLQAGAECAVASRKLVVTLDGGSSGSNVNGLSTSGNYTSIKGLAVGNFSGSGVMADATNLTLLCNHIGTAASGTLVASNGEFGVFLNGTDKVQIGDASTDGMNLISGNMLDGIYMTNNAADVTVLGNLVGTDINGSAALPNEKSGITIEGGQNIVIGDGTVGGRNILSGNLFSGLTVNESSGITVKGNYLGLNALGNGALGNGSLNATGDGMSLGGTISDLLVEDNVMSGQSIGDSPNGIEFYNVTSDSPIIRNNVFGLNAAGTASIGNSWHGLQFGGGNTASIITNALIEGNTFSGNGRTGVFINGSVKNSSFLDNRIGTSENGLTALGNGTSGVYLGTSNGNPAGPDSVNFGDGTSGNRNIIAGNAEDGVYVISSNGIALDDNYIGILADGSAAGNGINGVRVLESSDVLVQKNTVAHNTQAGLSIEGSASDIRALGNSLYENGGLGIDIQDTGVNINDGSDVDTGSNDLLNFPQFSMITIANSNLILVGCAPAGATVELFEADVSPTSTNGASAGDNQFSTTQDYGEGEIFLTEWTMPASGTACTLGSDSDGNDSAGMLAFSQSIALTSLTSGSSVVLGDKLTATATISGIGTSEFSAVGAVSDVDYGDAPISGTAPSGSGISNYGEAIHYIASGIQLGDAIDAESVSIADATASGDGVDDDGVSAFPALSTSSTSYTIPAANITATGTGTLHAWIDFDGSGAFDSTEYASTVVTAGVLAGDLGWTGQSTMNAGTTFARLRFTSDTSITAGSPASVATDGEVEDYSLAVIAKGGVAVSGRVFKDVNANAANDSPEEGISQLPVVLYDTINQTCISTRTDGAGMYTFEGVAEGVYQVYEASRESVPVPESCGPEFAKDPGGYRSTTDNARTAFTVTTLDITGQDFGDVNPPIFGPDNSGQVLAGNVLFYAHKFTTPTKGSVTFDNVPSGNLSSDWSSIIYEDVNCDGVLNESDGASPISGSVNIDEGSSVCLINKVYAPSNVAANDSYIQEITASFDYGNTVAGTESLTVQDVTTAQQVQAPTTPSTPEVTVDETQAVVAATSVTPEIGPSRLELRKTVRNITKTTGETATANTAEPGDTLEYRVYYRNSGTGPVTDLVINDVIPPYTSLLGTLDCGVQLSGMACTADSASLDGALKWVFTGSLIGGAESFVSYQVLIDE